MSSDNLILLIINLKSRMILQNICLRVVGNDLINNFPSNIFPTMFCSEIFQQNCQAVLTTMGILFKDNLSDLFNIAVG